MKFINSNKFKILYIILLIVFVFGYVSSAFLVVRAESAGLNANYIFSLKEYNEYIESQGLSENPIYKMTDQTNEVKKVFPDYQDIYINGIWDVLRNSETLNSLEYGAYKYIDVVYSYGDFELYIFTSDYPFQYIGGNLIFYNNNGTDFDVKKYCYQLLYSSNNNVFALGSALSGNDTLAFNKTSTDVYSDIIYLDGVCYKGNGSVDNTINNYVLYSDGEVHAQTVSWSIDSIPYTKHFITMSERANLVSGGYGNYESLGIDRRTLIPSFVAANIDPREAFYDQESRCGFDGQFYYVSGSGDNLKSEYGFIMNDYVKYNKDHINLNITYDVNLGGNYSDLSDDFETEIKRLYGITTFGGLVSNECRYTGDSMTGTNIISIPLSDYEEIGIYKAEIYPYLANYFVHSLPLITADNEGTYVSWDKFLQSLCTIMGTTSSRGSNTAFGINISNLANYIGLSTLITQTSSNAQRINYCNVVIKLQLVDTENSSKNSGTQIFSYNMVSGNVSNYGDSIIYDDSDLYDQQDNPDYKVPTLPVVNTPTDATPGSDTTVTTNTGNVTVTNTNNVNVTTPDVNVVVNNTGGTSGTDQENPLVLYDDDSIEYEDVQGVVDDVENFLDFGDTFFDEYLAQLFSVIPVQVWKPFAIAAGFISLGAMIRFLLKR